MIRATRIFALLALPVLLLALVACAAEEEDEPTVAPQPTTAAAAPTAMPVVPTAMPAAATAAPADSMMMGERGGTMAASVPYDVFHFDPHRNGATPALMFFSNVFEHLAAVNPQNREEIAGQIATKWESSGDGTEWTYTIRQGIQWHDGESLGADDVVGTFQRVLDRPNDMPIGRLKCINALVDTVEQIDEETVKVVLGEPAVNYFACWTQPFFHILPKQLDRTGSVQHHAANAGRVELW